MTESIAQLKKAQHIINLQFDDLQDLSNNMPTNKALDKELHELIEKQAHFLYQISQELKKRQKPVHTENKLDPIAFNKVFNWWQRPAGGGE